VRIGAIIAAGFVALAIVSTAPGWRGAAVRPLGVSGWFPLRHAALHLTRPGGGASCCSRWAQHLLHPRRPRLQEGQCAVSVNVASAAPMFLLDIQSNQLASVPRRSAQRGAPVGASSAVDAGAAPASSACKAASDPGRRRDVAAEIARPRYTVTCPRRPRAGETIVSAPAQRLVPPMSLDRRASATGSASGRRRHAIRHRRPDRVGTRGVGASCQWRDSKLVDSCCFRPVCATRPTGTSRCPRLMPP
jgi:hypothetical protein